MKRSFTSIALLLVAFLVSVIQVAAASVDIQDDNHAEAKEAGFPVYDMYRSLYNEYYSRWVAHTMM